MNCTTGCLHLRFCAHSPGKDSWKVRNEALGTVLEKASQGAKYGIVSNSTVKTVLQALVRRLADTNQNLRPKAADCIAAIAKGVGADIEKVWGVLGFVSLQN